MFRRFYTTIDPRPTSRRRLGAGTRRPETIAAATAATAADADQNRRIAQKDVEPGDVRAGRPYQRRVPVHVFLAPIFALNRRLSVRRR
jgi:hypothetical protein